MLSFYRNNEEKESRNTNEFAYIEARTVNYMRYGDNF